MILIKNRFTGATIREIGAETLQDANLQDADLRGAETLQDANLQDADLWGADLRGANLRGANLRGADLWGADLRGADLQNANLQDANLQNANLQNANLQNANLQDANLQDANLPIFCKWRVSYTTDGIIKIGCKEKTVADWDAFFGGSGVYDTPRDSPDFKRIRAVYEAYKAYLNILNS